jgi:hypothetical protein
MPKSLPMHAYCLPPKEVNGFKRFKVTLKDSGGPESRSSLASYRTGDFGKQWTDKSKGIDPIEAKQKND